MANTDHPGYRGALTLFFDGILTMMNPYAKPWKIRVRRRMAGWDGDVFEPSYAGIDIQVDYDVANDGLVQYPQTDRLIKAMNPAHMIYECLTNRVWGRGLPRASIDEASFAAAAQALHAEGFGMCLKWSRADNIENFVQSIINTIGAATYAHRETGLIKLKLIRSDYTFASLPLFDTSTGLLEITDASVAAPSNQISECIVTYRDQITDKDRKVRVKNTAALQSNAGVANTMLREYKGIPVPELALRVAQRDLRAASSRLRRYSFTLDRRGWGVYPGDVIRIRDIARGIPDTAVRVATYDDGTLENGRIKITAVQDVFSLPTTSYTGIEHPQWVPPTGTPCIGRHRAFEAPYFAVAGALSAADFNALTGDGAMFAMLAEEGQPANTTYDIVRKYGAPALNEQPVNTSYYCPL